MSVSSLTRFTVPLNSDQSSGNQALLMPKLKYRFRVTLENFGVTSPRTELTKQVIDVTRPSVTWENIEIPVYNSKVNLAGKYTWDPFTLNIKDDMTGAVARLVGEQVQKQFDFMEQASAVAGIDYKFISRVEILDGGNGIHEVGVLETWELYGCYVETVNYNDLNYATSEPATISLTVRFDNALQTPLGSGVGAAVARTLGSAVTG